MFVKCDCCFLMERDIIVPKSHDFGTIMSRSIEKQKKHFLLQFFSHHFHSISVILTDTEDGARYSGLADAVMKIYTQEGVLAFWTGFGAYYMRTAPHAMIILMTTQPITDHYKRTFNL